jgi:predicted phage baseplate assembly protein
MALPAPNLDDRRFQELVDEAKRMVMQRCPEWTDHNVSDPGVTLIETFAYMTDLLLYRLNRVPERLYVKFLELIGLRLYPPTAARTDVTFWLSAPAEGPLVIPAGTNVATLRSEQEEPVVFSTNDELRVIGCSLQAVATEGVGTGQQIDQTDRLHLRASFAAFSPVPIAGDTFLIALSEAVPRGAVMLQFDCSVEGIGVDPTNPPLIWEAWSGETWERCEVDRDETGGLNRAGAVVVHVPPSHRASVLNDRRAGWLRARVRASEPGEPSYTSSPVIRALQASTVGGTIGAVHAELVQDETLGASEGTAGQRFAAQRSPILRAGDALRLNVTTEEGWEEWTEVEHFAASGPDDRHFVVDAVAAEICFGPAVREADGTLRRYGSSPPKGALIQLPRYAVGGGRRGNVSKGAIRTLKSSIPFVASVENRRPAVGGVEGETLDEAKARGPILLRTRSRAVTAEDFEQLARAAAPEIARVRCIAANNEAEAGGVRVLVVPAAETVRGQVRFEDLVPPTSSLEAIREELDSARLIGTRVVIEPPLYRGVTIVAQLRARPRADVDRIRSEALERLGQYFNPLVGGPDGTGWPWGRPVQSGDAFAVLQGVPGVDVVEDVRLFGANPVTGERGPATARIVLEPDSLVVSFEHQVRVDGA